MRGISGAILRGNGARRHCIQARGAEVPKLAAGMRYLKEELSAGGAEWQAHDVVCAKNDLGVDARDA